MLEKSQEYLRLAVAAAALLIGLSIAYHYVVYIPEKDRAKDAQAASKAADEMLRAEKEQASAEKASLERRTNYRICLSNAQENYSNRWDSSCKSRSDLAEKNRADCLARGIDASYCQTSYPPFPAANCSLPNNVSDDYDAMLREEKQLCLDEAKSDVLDET